jgi:diguanylate cyclase (GGDEF)-like protein
LEPLTVTIVLSSLSSGAAAGIALGAVAVGLLIALLVVLLTRKPAPSQIDERLAFAVESLNERIEMMGRNLADVVERSEDDDLRNRYLGELGASIDLDEVLERTLEAAGALPGADAALVTVTSTEGKPIVATLGLSAEEAARQAVAGPPDGRRARAISISYRYTPDEVSRNGLPIRAGIAVPLPGDADPPGVLTIFTRSGDGAFDDGNIEALEQLAFRAGPAIENACRFREARRLADLDALTGLHNRRYFHETLAREVSRAHRYERKLTLIVLDLDDFKAFNDRIGHLAGDAVLAGIAERVREVVRAADIACRVGGDEFAVILPESTFEDAEQLYARLRAALAGHPVDQPGQLHVSAGVAELKPGDDSNAFFQRADEALYSAKKSGKGQVVTGVGAVGPA